MLLYIQDMTVLLLKDFLCPLSYGEGDIMFLVWIQLAFMLASLLARYFLVYTISCESVVGFLPNLHGYIIGT